MNAIRKHISASKGGQMARAAYPATTINLMLIRCCGRQNGRDCLRTFCPGYAAPLLRIRGGYPRKGIELIDIPRSIRDYIDGGVNNRIQETPKEGDLVFQNVHNYIIGSNILALEAALEEAEGLGYESIILSSMIEGETKDIAGVHTAIANEVLKSGRPLQPPCCIISGGETTVTIKGKGKGGRNQEFCLSAAIGLERLPLRVVILSGGTDGNDGPTDAAGAIVDGLTVEKGRQMGMDAAEYLGNNDSYHFLGAIDELLITGPTNTNVMDVRFVLVK